MSIEENIGRLLDELGLGVYDPDDVGATIFVGDLPDQPDAALAVRSYPGGQGDAKYGWDSPNFQVLVRGAASDSAATGDRAQAVYDQLHGLSHRDLHDGTHLLTCVGLQSGPVWLSRDTSGRPRLSVNFRADTERANTPNRQ